MVLSRFDANRNCAKSRGGLMNTGSSSPPVSEDSILAGELSSKLAEAPPLQATNQVPLQRGQLDDETRRPLAAPATLSDTESSGTSELVAAITHDFNNILHVIQAHTELILHRSAAASEVFEHAEVIKETIDEGIVLVRRLTGEPKSVAMNEPRDINVLLQRTIKSLAPVFPPGIAITSDLDPQTPLIQFDDGLMYRSFLNLCMNAREAMPQGGTLLVQTGTISGAALRQRFPDAKAERYVAVIVSDTGLGMEPAVKERIFDLRFTSKKSGEGSGLGLSIVQAAVSSHQGFIEVSSKPGCGSAFRVYLPAPGKQPATHASMSGKSAGDSARNDVTVLYAEDDARLLGLMQRFLEKEGLKVFTARDGIEALDVHSGHPQEIAAVIFDSHLPKLDGWEAFQRMRKINPKLKGIIASGFVSAEAESRVAKGELSGVLQKPYFGAELLAVIKQVIRSQ